MTCIRLPRLIVIRFLIFACSFVDAFVFREVLDGPFLQDDTTEDCDADVLIMPKKEAREVMYQWSMLWKPSMLMLLKLLTKKG